MLKLLESRLELDKKEVYSGSVWVQKKSFRIALISSFSALAVVLGYALAIPNVELFTLMIFLGGIILGKINGSIIGLISSMIYYFFNPWGPPTDLILYIYQIIHYSMTGMIGGYVQNFLSKKKYFKPKEDLYIFRIMLIFGFIGASITFIYDIISTIIPALLYSYNFIILYIGGIIFTTTHLIGNTLGFVFILPGLVSLLYKLLY